MIEVLRYRQEDGGEPFSEWLGALRDRSPKPAFGCVFAKSRRETLATVNPSAGVIELRVHVGAGYRVYCGRHGRAIVILLCGGDKRSQPADIGRAKELWSEWKRR